jgi:hypothetical protein
MLSRFVGGEFEVGLREDDEIGGGCEDIATQ